MFRETWNTFMWLITAFQVLSRLKGPNGFCSHYHSSTHTFTCESQGHWVQRVQSGSITPCSQRLKFSSLVIKLAHLYFLLDCFEEQGLPGSQEVTASGSESKLNIQTQGTSCIVVSSTRRKHSKHKGSQILMVIVIIKTRACLGFFHRNHFYYLIGIFYKVQYLQY